MGLFSSKPPSFFRAFAISGVPADIGHSCETCHSTIRYGIQPGTQITCYGVTETAPDTSDWYDLPCRSLRRGLPEIGKQGFIVLDTDASNYGPDWDADSAAKSDDSAAYEVDWV
jgi:hypothetical protein